MTNYLQQQSVGQILRNTFAIYGKGFGVIFLTYFLPTFPFLIWQTEAKEAGQVALGWVGVFCGFVVGLFSIGAITIAVSDLCLGNRPSVSRSYRKVFGSVTGRLLGASLLQGLFILLGFVLLIVPGVLAVLWLLFTPCVVVLEGLGAWEALKRSKALGKGFNGRNFGVFLLLFIIVMVAGGITGGVFGAVWSGGGFVERIFMGALQTLTAPLTLILIVLLYYDLRVRKEAYDAAALTEDLRR